ncbi:MAG: hypothetical protein ACPW60_02910 [Methylohalobius sp. ZOD2]|nr:hypothetical protein [Methylothermaceae bacterium]
MVDISENALHLAFHIEFKLKYLYEHPDNPAPGENLFQAINLCMGGYPMPKWAREAWVSNWIKYDMYGGQFEQVFGLYKRTKSKINREANKTIAWQSAVKWNKRGYSTGPSLWEKVFEETGIKPGTVNDYYNSINRTSKFDYMGVSIEEKRSELIELLSHPEYQSFLSQFLKN